MVYGIKSEPGKEPCDWKVFPFVDVGAEEQFQARFLDLANAKGDPPALPGRQ